MVVIDEDEAIWNAIKDFPDVECFPLPIRFFKKFGIQPRSIETTKEYLATQYTIQKSIERKDLPPLIIDEPQRDAEGKIKLVAVAPPEEIVVETVQRPFVHEEGKTLVVLPSLRDDSDLVTGDHTTSSTPLPQHHTTPSAFGSEMPPCLDSSVGS
jgi:hypothetical protein